MGIEYRTNVHEQESRIVKKESETKDHYKILTDEHGREIKIERYENGNVVFHIDVSYEVADGIEKKIERFFIYNEFKGHNVSIENGDIFEMYDKDGILINLLKGTYDYLIQNGKPTRKLYDLLRE